MAFPASGGAQTVPAELQSVSVGPADVSPNSPANGSWFTTEPRPGEKVTMRVRLKNPVDINQPIKLYLADLVFTPDGSRDLAAQSTDVGTWGGFATPEVVVPARGVLDIPFTLTVPTDAEPGDHVGAVVAESRHASSGPGQLAVVKRVTSRLYVTVPGYAQPDYSIEKIELKRSTAFFGLFTREITSKVVLRNTGRVRLRPAVTVNSQRARGSDVLLSRSVETYLVTEKVPLWGGPRQFKASVTSVVGSDRGPAREAQASTFVFPWILPVAMVALVLSFLGLRRLLARRRGRYAALQSDMRRIERLLQEQRSNAVSGDVSSTGEHDPEAVIKAAIKKATRGGDTAAVEKLKLKLEEQRALAAAVDDGDDDDVVVALLRQIPGASPKRRPALIRAALAFGPKELKHHADLIATLPAEVQVELLPSRKPELPSAAAEEQLEAQPEVAMAPPEPGPVDVAEPAAATTPPAAVADAQPEPVSGYDWLREDAAAVEAQPTGGASPRHFYDSLRDVQAPQSPPRMRVESAVGPGYFVPDPSTPPAPEAATAPAVQADDGERDETLAVILREIGTAPAKRQDALIRAARSYGVRKLRAHGEQIEQLPPDTRAKLLPKEWVSGS
jgi:hypothetical protein